MQVEELKPYFQPNTEWGERLPNPKSMNDNTIFYLKTNGVYYEHIMWKNEWYKKQVDADNNLILVKV